MFEDNNVEMVARAWFELESQKQQEISEQLVKTFGEVLSQN